ncbi:MAG TPA: hypothetical protein VIP10_09845 [Burkholderiaceae bacterium]
MTKTHLTLLWGETQRSFRVERTAPAQVGTSAAYARAGYSLVATGLTEHEARLMGASAIAAPAAERPLAAPSYTPGAVKGQEFSFEHASARRST